MTGVAHQLEHCYRGVRHFPHHIRHKDVPKAGAYLDFAKVVRGSWLTQAEL